MDYIDALAARPAGRATPEIKAYLDLSTVHLSHRTRVALAHRDAYGGDWPAMSIGDYAYGWFATVPDSHLPEVAAQMTNLPPDLAQALRYAAEKGCELIRFDADGYVIEDLPTYKE